MARGREEACPCILLAAAQNVGLLQMKDLRSASFRDPPVVSEELKPYTAVCRRWLGGLLKH